MESNNKEILNKLKSNNTEKLNKLKSNNKEELDNLESPKGPGIELKGYQEIALIRYLLPLMLKYLTITLTLFPYPI